jgi:cell division protease FtsH
MSNRTESPPTRPKAPPRWRTEGIHPPANEPTGQAPRSRLPRWFPIVFVLILATNLIISSNLTKAAPRVKLSYTSFLSQVEQGNVIDVTARGLTIQGTLTNTVTVDKQTGKTFETERPVFASDDLLTMFKAKAVVVNARPVSQPASWWQSLLYGFGPTLLFVGLLVWLSRRAAAGMGGIGGIGRSKAKLYTGGGPRTTFADVAGIDEARDELVEIVDYLRDPDRYRRLGAQIPRGVLLTGQPGTGKTLLAKAVAGEANVPFFSMSASEFIEMIVGVGASRVRDLFDQAKKAAPAIIFIDELDSIGRARGAAMSFGGHDEREQTLNQILTEMDGFTGTEGVIVLAATNRPEILDPALMRAGRFDRHVAISPPDAAGRAAILAVHTRGVPLDPATKLEDVAASTPGMVGADLRNLVNEAALLAARRDHISVTSSDFADALERIVLGSERRIMLSPEERKRTAYHEAGHALLGMLLPGADPVRKVSIIPRGRALGVTFQSPSRDRYGFGIRYLKGRITGALGGRAAEEIVFGDITTGAESDLEVVTATARQMVGRWGMSPAIGPISVLPDPQDERMMFPGMATTSDLTRELVDHEIQRIVTDCHAEATRVLGLHREQLDRLAGALLTHETLDEADAYRIVGLPAPAIVDLVDAFGTTDPHVADRDMPALVAVVSAPL